MVLQQGCLIWYGDLLGIHVKRSASKWPFLTRLIFKSRWNVIQVDLARLWSFPGAGNTNLALTFIPPKKSKNTILSIKRMHYPTSIHHTVSYLQLPTLAQTSQQNINKFIIRPGSLTARPWKMMVGRLSPFLLGPRYLFRGELLNFGRVHIHSKRSPCGYQSPITPSLWGCDVPCSVSRRRAWMLITGYQRCGGASENDGRNFVTDGWWSIWAPYGSFCEGSGCVFVVYFFQVKLFYQKSPKITPNMTILMTIYRAVF